MLEFYTVFDIVCVISFMRINLNRCKFIVYGSFDAAIQQVTSQFLNTFFVAESTS